MPHKISRLRGTGGGSNSGGLSGFAGRIARTSFKLFAFPAPQTPSKREVSARTWRRRLEKLGQAGSPVELEKRLLEGRPTTAELRLHPLEASEPRQRRQPQEDSGPSEMAAQPQPRAVLRGTTQMSLNERFTTLLENTGPRPENIRPSGWQRPPGARDLRRRGGRHVDYTPRRLPEAGHPAGTRAQRRAPFGSPEGALAGAAIGGGPDPLFIHRDWALEGARGASVPRTVLKGGMSPGSQDPLPAGLASAPRRNFRRGARPARRGPRRRGPHREDLGRGAEGRLRRSPAQRLETKGPRPRARFGAQGRGQGQGRSPLNRPRLTKEQLDAELDAYMAQPKVRESLDADLQAYMAQAVPPDEGLDSDSDAYMAPAVPDEEGQDADLDVYMKDADPDAPTKNTDP